MIVTSKFKGVKPKEEWLFGYPAETASSRRSGAGHLETLSGCWRWGC